MAGCHLPADIPRPTPPRAPFATIGSVPPGKNRGIGRAVDLGQGNQHGGFHRPQPAVGLRPLAKCLKLQRMGGDIGQIQIRQNPHRGRAVVIGRPADQAEPGQRYQRIDPAPVIGGNGGPSIQPARKGRHHGQALRLKGARITAS